MKIDMPPIVGFDKADDPMSALIKQVLLSLQMFMSDSRNVLLQLMQIPLDDKIMSRAFKISVLKSNNDGRILRMSNLIATAEPITQDIFVANMTSNHFIKK